MSEVLGVGVLGTGTSAVYLTGIEGDIPLPASVLPTPHKNVSRRRKRRRRCSPTLRWLNLKVW